MAKSAKGEKKGSGAILGIAIVTLLAVGAGGGFGFYLSGNLKTPADAHPAKPAHAEEKLKVPSGAKLVELAPIIANLAEPKNAFVRIEGSLVLEGEVEDAAALGSKISEDIVAYLKTTSLAQFEGASGFQYLREDLNDRARVRGGKEVRELVIHGMVVE